ncbi:MAG: UDP-2,3-diacylglucosamine diphosphatase [Gammaproteobacteria bacterium]
MRLFAADLHLCGEYPVRLRAFVALLHRAARDTAEVYLLGDIFDAWPGDDNDDETARGAAAALSEFSAGGGTAFIQRGNRDFLLGGRFCRRAGCALLSDLHVLECGGRRFLLAHGDSFSDDEKYLRWRKIARGGAISLLARILPLSARRRAAAALRRQSANRRRAAEISPHCAAAALRRHHCAALIHGHLHAPGEAEWEDGGARFVRHCLPDWESAPGAFLRMDAAGALFSDGV